MVTHIDLLLFSLSLYHAHTWIYNLGHTRLSPPRQSCQAYDSWLKEGNGNLYPAAVSLGQLPNFREHRNHPWSLIEMRVHLRDPDSKGLKPSGLITVFSIMLCIHTERTVYARSLYVINRKTYSETGSSSKHPLSSDAQMPPGHWGLDIHIRSYFKLEVMLLDLRGHHHGGPGCVLLQVVESSQPLPIWSSVLSRVPAGKV